MIKSNLIKIKIFIIIILGIFSIYLFAVILKLQNLNHFKEVAYNHSKILNLYFKNNQILGTTRSFGLADPRLKRIVKGIDSPDDANLLKALNSIKDQYAASIVYVLNKEGTAVASTRFDDNQTLTGNNYSFRPYFSYALKGRDTVYPALGVTTKQRGLYYSSPVYDDSTDQVIGALVVKMGLSEVDYFINQIDMPVAIKSPQNIIFSTNQKAWLLRPLVPLEEEQLFQIKDSQQFSDSLSINPIGFLIDSGQFKFENTVYSLISIPVSLTDENGVWDLVFFVENGKFLPVGIYSFGVGVIAFFYLLLIYIMNVQAQKAQVREALALQNQRLLRSQEDLKKANRGLLDNEQKLKILNASLDSRVKERTKALEEEKHSLELKVKERTKDLEEERKSLEEKVQLRTKELEEIKVSLEEKVRERTEELAQNIARLEESNKSMIGREKRIIELKAQVKDLETKLMRGEG